MLQRKNSIAPKRPISADYRDIGAKTRMDSTLRNDNAIRAITSETHSKLLLNNCILSLTAGNYYISHLYSGKIPRAYCVGKRREYAATKLYCSQALLVNP